MADRDGAGRGRFRRRSEPAAAPAQVAPVQSERPGLSYEEMVAILFPRLTDEASRRRIDEVSGGEIRDKATIRRVIGAVDQQAAWSPFSVRFGPDDVCTADLDGLGLVLDRADASVAAQMVAPGGYEPHMTRLFRERIRPGMTVVDVGANVGYFTVLAAHLAGPTGRVVAVEPSSENCRLLLTSLRAAGDQSLAPVELFPLACTAERGWAYLSSHVGTNGGLIDDADLVARPGTVVPTFPLDDLVTGRVDVLKMDVEGAEARVAAGARRILEEERPLVTIELSCEMLPRVSGVSVEEFLGGFVELGYGIAIVDKESGDPIPQASVDALLADWGDPYRIEDLLLSPGAGAD